MLRRKLLQRGSKRRRRIFLSISPGFQVRGIPVAPPAAMLLLLILGWAVLVVAICSVCAAGGAADERSEKWYADRQESDKPPQSAERGAA